MGKQPTGSLPLPRIGFIGAGVVGRSLAVLLHSNGYPVLTVSSRSRASAEALSRSVGGCKVVSVSDVRESADLIFLTVPDDQVEPVASLLADRTEWRTGQAVVHCSGALSLEPLKQLREQGVSVGSIHPLQSLASFDEAVRRIPGSYFGVEADEPLRRILAHVVSALGGHLLVIPGGAKARYHLAATVASNYMVTLFSMAVDLLSRDGISRSESASALLPLLRGTVENLDRLGLPRALTGPIARGDVGTVNRHLHILRAEAPGFEAAYRQLGVLTLPVAVEKGTLTRDLAGALLLSLGGTEAA